MFGRLGTSSEADELSPVEVKFGTSEPQRKVVKFVGVSAGAYHSLALAGLLFFLFIFYFYGVQTFGFLFWGLFLLACDALIIISRFCEN